MVTRDWYTTLKPNSIGSLKEFVQQFIAHFASSCKPYKIVINLMAMQQKGDKSLKSFIAKFNEQSIGMSNLTIPSIVTALIKGLKDEHFIISLSKNASKTIADLRFLAKKYINAKEALQAIDKIDLTGLNPKGINT